MLTFVIDERSSSFLHTRQQLSQTSCWLSCTIILSLEEEEEESRAVIRGQSNELELELDGVDEVAFVAREADDGELVLEFCVRGNAWFAGGRGSSFGAEAEFAWDD